jgi:hypothetical protein
MSRTCKTFLCLLLTLLNVFLAYGGTASARVLCIGSDGHIAVETSATHVDCTLLSEDECHPSGATAIEGRSCVDVPIDSGSTISGSRSASPSRPLLHDSPAILAALVVRSSSAVSLDPTFAPACADHIAALLAALRTVILVI